MAIINRGMSIPGGGPGYRRANAAATALVVTLLSPSCLQYEPYVVNGTPMTREEACGTEEERKAALEPQPEVPDAFPPGVAVLPTAEGHRLLASNPFIDPFKVIVPKRCISHGREAFISGVVICVSNGGTVSSVTVVKRSLPIIDRQLPEVIGRWSYQPYELNGEPTPFCYRMNYQVR